MKFLRRAFSAIALMGFAATGAACSRLGRDAAAARGMAPARTARRVMKVAVVGRGVVGQRISRRLPTVVDERCGDRSRPAHRARPPERRQRGRARQGGPHADVAHQMIQRGVSVISVSDDLADVRSLIDLDDSARDAGVPLVVGAGMDPGLTGLARPSARRRSWPAATRSTSPSTAPQVPPAPVSTTARSAAARSGFTTASGCSHRLVPDGSCVGFPSRWAPTTATGRSLLRRSC